MQPFPIVIRLASAADLPAAEAIFRDSPEASLWTAADLDGYTVLVAETEEPSARMVVGAAVARVLAPGEAELLNVAVIPEYRRRGIAEQLIRRFFLFSPGDWYLEVRETNTPAIQLYEKAGFLRVGRRAAYYADTGEAAIVMGFRAC